MKTKILHLVIITFCSANLFSQNIRTSTDLSAKPLNGVADIGLAEVSTINNLIAYAYVAYDPTNGLPQGPCSFELNDPDSIVSLAPGTAGNFIAAGTWANGKWYGEEFGVGNLYEIDHLNGNMTFIGSCGLNIGGLAWDGTTMYACTGTQLVIIDPEDGTATMVGPMGNTQFMVGIACNSAGEMYGVDIYDDNLYSINKTTGAATVIGPLGIDLSEYAQDIAYDKSNDVLYLAGFVDLVGKLYTVNTSTGAATMVGEFMNGAELDAFAIPYGIVTDISENSPLNIQVYPNPASAFVDIKSNPALGSVRIFNHNGQEVFNKELNSKYYRINTSNLTSGVYHFLIKTEEGSVSRRIVVK